MFLTPYGRFVPETDSLYSLFGTVVVPGNGLVIQQLDFSVPPGMTVPPTFFPVQIVLGAADAPPTEGSLMVSMPLDFRATGPAALPVGGSTGMTHVVLMTVLGTAVVGTAVIRVPIPSAPIFPDVTAIAPCERWGWVAWRNASPSAQSPLHVQGYFEAESFGYVGKLTVAVPQGFDQDELLLRLTFTAVEGVHARVRARIPVKYEDPRPLHEYKRVAVRYPSGAICQVAVMDLG
jgi:hypothetical protein